MPESYKKKSSKERKLAIQKVIAQCRKLAQDHVDQWTPVDKSWRTIEGCAYLRLSTDEQVAVEKGSLEQQVHIAIAEARRRSQQHKVNYRITRFFIEPGITGRTDERPEFEAMKAEIERAKYEFVIFKEIARVARETTIWKSFFKLCIDKGCEIVINNFPFDPNNPAQILQLDILAAFAEYESNLISKRVRETNFSAMITSGKFNSTHKMLGLDQWMENGEPKVGFYVPNPVELKTVEWIMRTFVKYASYQKVLEECEKHGVRNKGGQPFLRHSLITLLTNQKYIGKWEVNRENKDKHQDRLMPYDRYMVVELPHGCVVDLALWEEVQALVKRIAGNKDKNTQIKRIYPLSGIMRTRDGRAFNGTGAWKEESRKNYYFNKKHNIRLRAEEVEAEATKVLKNLIQDTPELQDAIRRRGAQVKNAADLLENDIQRTRLSLDGLAAEKDALNRRLDFLLGGADPAEAQAYKDEYRREMHRINEETDGLKRSLEVLVGQRDKVQGDCFDWRDVGVKAGEVLEKVQENDPVAFKNAMRSLFSVIWVGDLEEGGVRRLEFVLRDGTSPAASVAAEENSSSDLNLG